jgi:hypothetical protein
LLLLLGSVGQQTKQGPLVMVVGVGGSFTIEHAACSTSLVAILQ